MRWKRVAQRKNSQGWKCARATRGTRVWTRVECGRGNSCGALAFSQSGFCPSELSAFRKGRVRCAAGRLASGPGGRRLD